MIPYFDSLLFELPFPRFHLPLFGEVGGSVSVYMFGVLVALGVVIGDRIVVAEGAKRGLDPRDVRYLNARMVIGGFIMAHVVSVVFYFPERIKENPLVLLNFWSGLSSFGGFLGAAITYLYLSKKEKIPRLPYADAVALGLAVGWIFGRMGCTTAHDHPGRHSTFFLAVRYPDGARHDLGFDELLCTIVMTAILFRYARKPRPAGRIIGLFATIYAPVRFFLDFLRATDVARPDERYGGLTPAQWACMAALAVGIWLLRRPSPLVAFTGPPPAVAEPAAEAPSPTPAAGATDGSSPPPPATPEPPTGA